MSVSVLVSRAPADYQGDDISDQLIASDAQAIERGRMEIERESTDRMQISATGPLHTYMRPGSIVQVDDLQRGKYRAMLRSFTLTIERQPDGTHSAMSSVVMEREL